MNAEKEQVLTTKCDNEGMWWSQKVMALCLKITRVGSMITTEPDK